MTQQELRPLESEYKLLTEGDKGLERVWNTFAGLCRIPRPSGNEAKAISFVRFFAEQRGLTPEVDEAGNVLFILPATEGMDNTPGIVFQGHADMVALGDSNPAENGVIPYVRSDDEGQAWVTANNSTLGADNGIGVSLMLALVDERIPHGPLAFLITNREEIGLVSAREMTLKNELAGFKYLVNVDSEEEGEATISSAGAGDVFINYPVNTVPLQDRTLLDISLEGLMGGHSGGVIGERRLNAAKVLSSALLQLQEQLGPAAFNLVTIKGGEARNAIMKSIKATIAADHVDIKQVEAALNEIRTKILEGSVHAEEQQMALRVAPSDLRVTTMLDDKSTYGLVHLIDYLPDGVVKFSDELPDFPETSTNIGVIKPMDDDSGISIQIMSRSSKMDQLELIRRHIKERAELNGAKVEISPAYSGWPAVLDSEINRIVGAAWEKATGKQMKYRSTHGGLECGVLMGRFPHLQAISVGPTILGAHTTEEKVNIESVKKYYRLLREIVSNASTS